MKLSADAQLIVEGQLPLVRAARAWLARLPAGLGRVGTFWTARRRRARELQELATFDDRELRDLGLSRSDLLAINNGTYRRD